MEEDNSIFSEGSGIYGIGPDNERDWGPNGPSGVFGQGAPAIPGSGGGYPFDTLLGMAPTHFDSWAPSVPLHGPWAPSAAAASAAAAQASANQAVVSSAMHTYATESAQAISAAQAAEAHGHPSPAHATSHGHWGAAAVGGALIGAGLGGLLGAAFGAEAGSGLALFAEILGALGGQTGLRLIQGGLGAGGGAPPAPPAPPGFSGPPNPPGGIVDEGGINWVGWGPYGPGGFGAPGAIDTTGSGPNFGDLNLSEQANIRRLQDPNARYRIGMSAGMKNWLFAAFPTSGASAMEANLFYDFEAANQVHGTVRGVRNILLSNTFLWNLNIEDSRVPFYSDAALAVINAGLDDPGSGLVSPENPIGSFRAIMWPDGRIRTDRSAIFQFDSPLDPID